MGKKRNNGHFRKIEQQRLRHWGGRQSHGLHFHTLTAGFRFAFSSLAQRLLHIRYLYVACVQTMHHGYACPHPDNGNGKHERYEPSACSLHYGCKNKRFCPYPRKNYIF